MTNNISKTEFKYYKKTLHKIIDDVEFKHCRKCDKWLELNCFPNNKISPDGKVSNCFICICSRKKKCQFEQCDTYAICGYNFCRLHGGGKKCLKCDTFAINNKDYCYKHNPEKCKFEGCEKKQESSAGFCIIHSDIYRCKFEDCKKRKVSGRNGYCLSHSDKLYCIINNCNKLQTNEKMCQGHYCSGNIIRCAKILVHDSKTSDILKNRKNDITVKDLIDMYNKNNNCHWCSFPVKLECRSSNCIKLDNISLDRLDNTNGHMKNNCVISCLFCNYARSDCDKEQWKTVINILNGTLKILDFSKYDCSYHIWKTCKILKEYDKEHDKEELINSKWLHSEIKQNRWYCTLTGLPIYPSVHNYFPWHPSIDRVNNNIGHTKDNCVITCRFINLGKNDIDTEKFKEWFIKRFPNCKKVKTIYPNNFDNTFNKILKKYENDKGKYKTIILQ